MYNYYCFSNKLQKTTKGNHKGTRDIARPGRETIIESNEKGKKQRRSTSMSHDHKHHRKNARVSIRGPVFVLAQGDSSGGKNKREKTKLSMERRRNRTCKPISCIRINAITDIMHRHVFFSFFHLILLWFPLPGGAVSLVPLWFPLVIFGVLDGPSTWGPLALFFWQGTLAWRDAYAWCRFCKFCSLLPALL